MKDYSEIFSHFVLFKKTFLIFNAKRSSNLGSPIAHRPVRQAYPLLFRYLCLWGGECRWSDLGPSGIRPWH
jgi:hypothetical protein